MTERSKKARIAAAVEAELVGAERPTTRWMKYPWANGKRVSYTAVCLVDAPYVGKYAVKVVKVGKVVDGDVCYFRTFARKSAAMERARELWHELKAIEDRREQRNRELTQQGLAERERRLAEANTPERRLQRRLDHALALQQRAERDVKRAEVRRRKWATKVRRLERELERLKQQAV